MKRTVFVIGAVASAAFVLAPAKGADRAKEDAANRKIMHEYAKCVVKSKRNIASEAIVSNADNQAVLSRFQSLIDSECLGRVAGNASMKFGGDLFRYALADALVNVDFLTSGERDFSNRLPLAHLLPPSKSELDAALADTKYKRKRQELQKSFDNQVGVVWLSRYGECVVRRDPAKARLWLLTPPGVPEEISRINELQPAFNTCLGEGMLKFNRVTMRGTVAINYYRLAMATVQPVAGKMQ
jgi:hypothetical protein